MTKFYEEQRREKIRREREDQERRRHHASVVPSQKSPIPLNRYDEDEGGTYLFGSEDEDDFDEGCYELYAGQQKQTGGVATTRVVRGTSFKQFRARALYDFKALSNRELNLQKGEVVYVLRRLDANWFEGENARKKIGIFPTTYVTALESKVHQNRPPSPQQHQKQYSSTSSPTPQKEKPLALATALYDFTPQSYNTLELPLKKGDMVTILRKVDTNWFEGRKNSTRGIFPAAFVQVVDEDIRQQQKGGPPHSYTPNSFQLNQVEDVDYSPVPTKKSGGGQFRAVYGYTPLHSDELELVENDVVDVVEKCDDGWFVGTNLRTRRFGTFPGNYVTSV